MPGFSGAVEGGVLHGYDVVNNLTSGSTNPISSGGVYNVVNPIGTVHVGSGSVSSISNATHTDVLSATLPAGTYVIVRGCDFNSNSTGVRRVAKDNSSGRNAYVIVNAVSGFDTVIQYTEIITLSVQTEIKCNVYQNSGAAMNIWPYMYAVRIK